MVTRKQLVVYLGLSKRVARLRVCRILYKYLGTMALESNERRLRRSVSALVSCRTTYGQFYIGMRKNREKMHIYNINC